MDWLNVVLELLPYILTFAVGLILKSPYYQKGKRLVSEVAKALEDDKLTAEEIKKIQDVFK